MVNGIQRKYEDDTLLRKIISDQVKKVCCKVWYGCDRAIYYFISNKNVSDLKCLQ